MKQLWMVMLMVLFATSCGVAQDEVMSSPTMGESVQPMPVGNQGEQVYREGSIVENYSGGNACGCSNGTIASPVVDCGCVCTPGTYYYSGCCCGTCGCGPMFGGHGFRPMFGGFFGRSRCGCCY